MQGLTARDLMSTNLEVVSTEMTVQELATFLVDHEISGAPVADSRGLLVGVVSATDLLRMQAEEGEHVSEVPGYLSARWAETYDPGELTSLRLDEEGLRVKDIMTEVVYAVEADATVGHIAQTMLDSHLHRLFVVDDGKVVGVVSTSDLLLVLAEGKVRSGSPIVN